MARYPGQIKDPGFWLFLWLYFWTKHQIYSLFDWHDYLAFDNKKLYYVFIYIVVYIFQSNVLSKFSSKVFFGY